MVVYRLILSYRGGGYAGWQRQANALTVQEVLEGALADLLARPVRAVAASRTDAGVHARGQAVHIELPRPFPEGGLVHGSNQRLPEDVRVLAATRVPSGFHARKWAWAKEYSYRLVRARILSPLDAPFALRVDPRLDLEALWRATGQLLGRHDFSAFALAGGAHRQPFRTILGASWREQGADLTFSVIGDGFLRGMVRGLVGTLLEVATGRRSLARFTDLLSGGERGAAGPTAPPQGLVLERVYYPRRWRGGTSETGALAGTEDRAGPGAECGSLWRSRP